MVVLKVDITKNETLEADLSKFFGIKLLTPFPLAGQVFKVESFQTPLLTDLSHLPSSYASVTFPDSRLVSTGPNVPRILRNSKKVLKN